MRRIVQLKKRQEELEDGPLSDTLQAMDSIYAQQDATWVHTALPFNTRGVDYGILMHDLCVRAGSSRWRPSRMTTVMRTGSGAAMTRSRRASRTP